MKYLRTLTIEQSATLTVAEWNALLIDPVYARKLKKRKYKMEIVKKSTADIPFLLVSSTDHATGVEELTPTVKIRKQSGYFSTPEGTITELGYGWYALTATPIDTNSVGTFILHAEEVGVDPANDIHTIVW